MIEQLQHMTGWVQQHPWWILGGVGGILAPILIHEALNRQKATAETHGSARWATAKEIQQTGLTQPRGVMLGKVNGQYLRHDGPEHMLLVGPTRSGKGISTIIPTLLTWGKVDREGHGGSVIVFDPKGGENYDVTAPWRGEHVGPVYAFNPRRTPTCTRINVLDTIRLRTLDEFGDAQLIAMSLVSPEKMAKETATSKHFREVAGHLITAAILHVMYTSPRKSLAGVWDFLTQQHDSLDECLTSMLTTAHISQGTHQAIASLTRMIKNISGDREISAVWSTATRPLVIYNDPKVAASTDASDLNLNDLQHGENPIALYLIAPSTVSLKRDHPVYRVILDVAMAVLMNHKVRTQKHRLLTILDEGRAYGYMESVEERISDKAGYGMKDLLIFQDLDQMWDTYGHQSNIWGNCKVKVFYAPDNDATAERISKKLLGYQTVEDHVQQPARGRQPAGVSVHQHGRELLTTDELMDLPPQEEVIRITGMKPIKAEKLDYRQDRWLKERACITS